MAENQVNISQDKLKLTPIPLASIRVQQETIEKIEQLMTLYVRLKSNIQQNHTTKVNHAEVLVKQELN